MEAIIKNARSKFMDFSLAFLLAAGVFSTNAAAQGLVEYSVEWTGIVTPSMVNGIEWLSIEGYEFSIRETKAESFIRESNGTREDNFRLTLTGDHQPVFISGHHAKVVVDEPYKGEIREIKVADESAFNSFKETTIVVIGDLTSPSDLPSPGISEIKVEIEGIAGIAE